MALPCLQTLLMRQLEAQGSRRELPFGSAAVYCMSFLLYRDLVRTLLQSRMGQGGFARLTRRILSDGLVSLELDVF